MQDRPSNFTDPATVASYASDTPRKVPGLADLHRMAALLLAEQAPAAAHVLAVGAGGGLELLSLATAQPDWRFTGVDPSPAMLALAHQAVASFAERVELVTGLVDQVTAGPFDGATCLLTLHFLDRGERLRTLREIHRRLKPGARLVVAHHAPPGENAERWMARSVAFGAGARPDRASTAAAGTLMTQRLPLLTPREEEALLRDAGFVDVELFYAAFSFRGWVGSRA
ncbi:class I SAM-dependent methyltransferase [Azohydromonas lata]|uniref:Methyltransferase domain-containing protein n=1 Tax=Azohydromonas lata TaxID=45677 RepID=A0ABU5IFU9_9BURK|nr:methyltransferase [Azohydromonas lata]MDZ5457416.1 methyltransferase domain-containing protein [Azohydromonas lata]